MPVFAEQKLNAIYAEEQGFGIQLSLLALTEPNFANALNELLNNSKYVRLNINLVNILFSINCSESAKALFCK